MSDYISSAISGTAHGPVSKIPQSVPLVGQIANNAGGYVYETSLRTQLDRFLILGTQTNSYYATARNLTIENIDSVKQLIEQDPFYVAQRTLQVSREGLALRQQPTLFVWALLLNCDDEATKDFCALNTPQIARTATMAMTLANYVQNFGGWSRRKCRALSGFYTQRNAKDMAFQMAKYPSREGWSHLGLIRQTHPKGFDPEQVAVVEYLKGNISSESLELAIGPNALTGKDLAAGATSTSDLIKIIQDYHLTWEMIPTNKLNDPALWDVLVNNVGYQALVRNLNRLTKIGWLEPFGSNIEILRTKLLDDDYIARSRVHPFSIFLAAQAYNPVGFGGSVYGASSVDYNPIGAVSNILDQAFEKAFTNVEPTGLRHMICVDVSHSMTSEIIPGVSAMNAAAAIAMIIARTETNAEIFAFADGQATRSSFHGSKLTPMPFSSNATLSDVISSMSKLSQMFTGTDCSLPFVYATERKLSVDAFTVITDSETWAGKIHPGVALKQYRNSSGIDGARSAVVAMAPNHFSIADPYDPGMMDLAGLSSDLPTVLNLFYSKQI